MLYHKILAVTNNHKTSSVLAKSFPDTSQQQCAIDIVASSSDALQKVQASKYDLLITDYRISQKSGIRLIGAVRQKQPDISVIIMGTYISESQRAALKRLGINGFLKKPIRPAHIQSLVKQVLEQQEVSPVSVPPPAKDISPTKSVSSNEAITQLLRHLYHSVGAEAVVLLDHSGHAVSTIGDTGQIDITSMSALIAANFMATTQLSKLLGNRKLFQNIFHEGDTFDIFVCDVAHEMLLAVISNNSKEGVVRFYTNKLLSKLSEQLAQRQKDMPVTAVSFAEEADTALDQFFGHVR